MSGPSRVDGDAAALAIATKPAHLHAWAGLRFELSDGHPWVLETCATCGTVRRYRAFERTWDGTPTPRG